MIPTRTKYMTLWALALAVVLAACSSGSDPATMTEVATTQAPSVIASATTLPQGAQESTATSDAATGSASPKESPSTPAAATEWSEAAVSPKDGYNQVNWDPSAQLIWGSDLEIDNTVLLRTMVSP